MQTPAADVDVTAPFCNLFMAQTGYCLLNVKSKWQRSSLKLAAILFLCVNVHLGCAKWMGLFHSHYFFVKQSHKFHLQVQLEKDTLSNFEFLSVNEKSSAHDLLWVPTNFNSVSLTHFPTFSGSELKINESYQKFQIGMT